jgi:hypothetical protein
MMQVNELNASDMFFACYHVHVATMKRPSYNEHDITEGHRGGIKNGW